MILSIVSVNYYLQKHKHNEILFILFNLKL